MCRVDKEFTWDCKDTPRDRLTPCSRVVHETPTGTRLVKKFHAFYGTWSLITVLTSSRRLTLSWAKAIHSMASHLTSYRSVLVLSSHLFLGLLKANSHIPCRSHAIPLPCRAAKGLECVFPIWFTQYGRVWFTYAIPRPCRARAAPVPCHNHAVLKATSQGHGTARHGRGMSMAWHVWISIRRPETACGRPARVRLLPATTRSST
jgi:hypothetical protein